MNNIGVISFYGLIFGMVGTTLGGILGSFISLKSNKSLGFILEFAAGLMTAVICFDLIPETLNISNVSVCIIGIFIGIITMIFCNNIVDKIYSNQKKLKTNTLLKTGIIIAIGLAVHNFPEGLAIGAGFEASNSLGFKLAIAIALHDVPEGISIALPLKNGGSSKLKSIIITTLSGLTTGLGAFFGAIVGNISLILIGISLAFAAGAMLYIVSCELIPESKSIYKGRFASLGNILGILVGIIAGNL
ncbi:MAG TPA: ZIP family metal transporter [Candidatus Scatovivens faecipullorum]|nr:ZIP family metal transporter [Candidatus Scatovivens faecipullorum]